KYRPKKVSDTILPERLQKTFQAMVDSSTVPHLLLHGSPGVGKTTIARAMLNELGSDCYMANASSKKERSIGFIDQLEGYCSTVSFAGGRKYVILDEADKLTIDAQDAMRTFLEKVEKNCGFILTCNHAHKLTEAIHSRCTVIEFQFTKD